MQGSVEGITPYLQPVVHALLQARKEVNELLVDFPKEKLWIKPEGLASVGFHLQHLRGVLDRLFTYARNETLSEEKLLQLREEGIPSTQSVPELLSAFNQQVDTALAQLRETSADELLMPRGIGRKQIPSTVLGLLFHAAEHTMRHTGQLLVTVKIQGFSE
ncbi:MAG: DinB family protein [Chitinophagaceae bacterium]